MNTPADALERAQIDAVLRLAAAQPNGDGPPLSEVVRRRMVPPARRRGPGRAHARGSAAARCSRTGSSARTRAPAQPKVRVLSPALAETAGASRHSVIEIVNDDMPFLVDSTTMEINRQGLTLHLIVHPIFAVERDADGQLQSVAPRAPKRREAPRESWMHIEVDRLVDAAAARRAGARASSACSADVRAAVRDWKPMRARLQRGRPPNWSARRRACRPRWSPRARAFLQWLADDHFTLLGYRQHELRRARTARLALQRRAGQRPGRAARRPRRTQLRQLLRAAAGRRARWRARRAGAGRHQGQHALHGAPRRLHRLRRREALRRRRAR